MQGRRVRGRGLARLPFAGAALCAVAFALTFAAGVHAAPAGSVSMNPANTSLDVGDTVTLTLDLGGLDIHEVHLGVTYNASVVQVVDADAGAAGVQVLPGPFPGDDSVGNVLQNIVSAGIINYQYALDGNDEVSGTGTVATVQFSAVANGNANLAWSVRTITDANGATATASGSAAILVVGSIAPTPTQTPAPSDTPAATNTPGATNAAASTPTSAGSATATRTPTATRTATFTPTPGNPPASEIEPTSTPRITVISNSNAPTARGGVDPSQTDRANGLPDAGNDDSSIQWWRWSFFGGALMLAAAGWFFTFAVHYGDREVVLMDRWEARRRDHRRLPRR
ncbi:MAG: cohesin domain-containing protein [Dehalococcoidia bacterium]